MRVAQPRRYRPLIGSVRDDPIADSLREGTGSTALSAARHAKLAPRGSGRRLPAGRRSPDPKKFKELATLIVSARLPDASRMRLPALAIATAQVKSHGTADAHPIPLPRGLT